MVGSLKTQQLEHSLGTFLEAGVSNSVGTTKQMNEEESS